MMAVEPIRLEASIVAEPVDAGVRTQSSSVLDA
jgi:hypothetical protein